MRDTIYNDYEEPDTGQPPDPPPVFEIVCVIALLVSAAYLYF